MSFKELDILKKSSIADDSLQNYAFPDASAEQDDNQKKNEKHKTQAVRKESCETSENSSDDESSVIKYSSADEWMNRIEEKIVHVITESAERKAQEKIDQMLKEARSKVEEIEQTAYRQGLEKAENSIDQRISQEMADIISRFEKALRNADERLTEIYNKLNERLLPLSVEIAEKILHAEITINPGILEKTLGALLEEFERAEKVTVKMNGSDAAVLQDYIDNHRNSDSSSAKIKIAKESGLDRGDFILESSIGSIDAKIKTQLNEIERTLKQADIFDNENIEMEQDAENHETADEGETHETSQAEAA